MQSDLLANAVRRRRRTTVSMVVGGVNLATSRKTVVIMELNATALGAWGNEHE
jgi:hypothetical protein